MTVTRNRIAFGVCLLLFGVLPGILIPTRVSTSAQTERVTLWPIQSVDTVKYSRDLAREKAADPAFDAVINAQVRDIASVGATHVAIATPYDDEFLPMLNRWVRAARAHRLRVWFRGNWAGWEGWFGYKRIDRVTHIRKTEQFIRDHQELFEDGDLFTACPECENGGSGDPRRTGDVAGHRRFLIEEYRTTQRTFEAVGKKVQSNIQSMNGDVARLVMDRDTTAALDDVVTIDHYVRTPEELIQDITEIQEKTGGQVILGEFGVPIPNIHGTLSDRQQAQWMQDALGKLARTQGLVGMNYWTNVGGSTQLWTEQGILRPAADILRTFYQPRVIKGMIRDELGRPIPRATVRGAVRSAMTDRSGVFRLPAVLPEDVALHASAPGYHDQEVIVSAPGTPVGVTLVNTRENLLFTIFRFFRKLVGVH
ncbi:MAG: carboxypeptidase-like regulatory domain-containing protein [bacterium]|nr:carboxypeptidase-like regulatory domain-containing protein [bacterium]